MSLPTPLNFFCQSHVKYESISKTTVPLNFLKTKWQQNSHGLSCLKQKMEARTLLSVGFVLR